MWLQPSFFWIGDLQLGHGFELVTSHRQFAEFSVSSSVPCTKQQQCWSHIVNTPNAVMCSLSIHACSISKHLLHQLMLYYVWWQYSTSLSNSGLCWTVFARNRDTAVPAEGNGDLQTLICVHVARPRRCLTLSNPVPWQNWMAAYLGYTLRGWRRCFVADQLWLMTRVFI